MPDVDVKSLIDRHQRMLSDRLNYERDWRLLAEYLQPTKLPPLTVESEPGSRKTTFIYDSEGMTAPTKLAANLQGNLVNPSQKWQSIKAWPPELNERNTAQNWCEYVSTGVNWAIVSSNFPNVAGEVLHEAPIFGTGTMLRFKKRPERPGERGKLLWEGVPIGTYCIQEDAEGRVDTLVRKVKLSLRAAYQNWGEAIGPDLVKEFLKRPDKLETFTQWIMPRQDRNPTKMDRKNMPWANLWMWEEKAHLIHEGGFRHNPIICLRWRKATNEVWGTGQGHLALPDIRTLNRITELKLLGVAIDIAPVLFALQGRVVGDLIWEPSAVNWEKQANAVRTMGSGGRIDIATLQEDRLITKIRQVFFLDQIEALPPLTEGPPGGMSPYEIAKRYEQYYKLLGPIYGRLTTEFLQPIVEGTFWSLWDDGMLPPPPPELQGAELHIQYEGPLSRAQRADDVTGIERWLMWAQSVINMTGTQDVMDQVDLDEMGLTVAQVVGMPARITRGKEIIAQIRQQRAAAMQAQAQAQAAMSATQAMKNAAPMVKALQPAGGGAGAAAGGQA